jgi:hypothetical protein
MRNLNQIMSEIKDICKQYPVMQERMMALKDAGYDNINYVYRKRNHNGLYSAIHLPKKRLYRIQIGYTELQKGYPAAWCIDVSSKDVVDKVELPF